MIKIEGNDIMRDGYKVGWVDRNMIRDLHGEKLGYFEEDHVRNARGEKLGFMEGRHFYTAQDSHVKIPLEKIDDMIVGGLLPEIGKCAVYILIGA